MEIVKTKKEHKKQIESLIKDKDLAEYAVRESNRRHKEANDFLFGFIEENYPETKKYKHLEINHKSREIIMTIKKEETNEVDH